MKTIPKATAIELTQDERTVLEGFVRSTKTEYRLRQRARIVLLAAGGMATRAIGREVGCTTGTASKWRVRFAEHRLGGFSETGRRGAAPKYTAQTGKRILALLDAPVPAGYGRWSGPLISSTGRGREMPFQYLVLADIPVGEEAIGGFRIRPILKRRRQGFSRPLADRLHDCTKPAVQSRIAQITSRDFFAHPTLSHARTSSIEGAR